MNFIFSVTVMVKATLFLDQDYCDSFSYIFVLCILFHPILLCSLDCPPINCGFRGSLGCSLGEGEGPHRGLNYDCANLAQTYSSLLSLLILGDDLSRVDKGAVLEAIRLSQRDNGCFWSQGNGSESDMRFVFCAVAICHVLNDQSIIDWNKLGGFIKGSVNYDGGIGQGPGDESHGGSTFCAVASLALAGRLWDYSVLSEKSLERLVKWGVSKQENGFHGRTGKPDDTCYGFWIGAMLQILNSHSLCDNIKLRSFLLTAQHSHMGGFAKYPEEGAFPDILHTYFSIAALSLLREPTLHSMYAPLNLSQRAYDHWRKLGTQ